ncbi:hypothetical protein, partial [Paracraurococcus ruber]|uniref:hypothetical protein n=1 Tax=Paracraurococcus ruber TaxID=77675 RepID=UPI001908C67E
GGRGRAAAASLPPGLVPPDFVARHDLWRRLYLDPLTCLTPAHGWAPMTDAEWTAVAPYLRALGCGLALPGRAGERMADPRARLDAIFRAVTLKRPTAPGGHGGGGRAAWAALPAAFGPADTVSRSYRRWAHRELWLALLWAVAQPGAPAALRALTWRVCCAVRRGIRIMGLRAVVLARRLRLFSALPAPSPWLPDPELSELYRPIFLRVADRLLAQPAWRPPRWLFRLLRSMQALCGGRTRLRRDWEPA